MVYLCKFNSVGLRIIGRVLKYMNQGGSAIEEFSRVPCSQFHDGKRPSVSLAIRLSADADKAIVWYRPMNI